MSRSRTGLRRSAAKTAPPAGSTRSTGAASDPTAGSVAGDGEALRVTHWFDSGAEQEPYTATVRFRGRHLAPDRTSGLRREFVRDESIAGVVPRSGPVSITTEVYGLAPGEWHVTAELVSVAARRRKSEANRPAPGKTLPRAAWSWSRWAVSSGSFRPVTTRWAPLVRIAPAPAVIPGSWFALVALGSASGLALQALLLARAGLPVFPSLVLTVIAALAGLGGAKLRYVAMHPRTWRNAPGEGWAVDGFLVVLPVVLASGLLLLDLPIGLFLDTSTPALFLGVAVGRLGCFFTGCCAGRCTRSRWGVWSSDRRVGARRIPTQLLEAASGLLIGTATLAVILTVRPAFDGLVVLVALAAYTVLRRVLLPLRAARQPATSAKPVSGRGPSALRAEG